MTSRPLQGYEDWPAFARAADTYRPADGHGRSVAEALGVADPGEEAPPVVTESDTVIDGVRRRRLSWSTGFGPRTHAQLLTPADVQGSLPGVLALHCHGGDKWLGHEQLTGGEPSSREAIAMRDAYYGGRWAAEDLARRGFAVLAHDAFCWGSRGFGFDPLPSTVAGAAEAYDALWRERGETPTEAERYNVLAGLHEQVVAKTAGVLGTSLAGTVARDDLIALRVLLAVPEVDAARIGTFGFSGGGGRAVALAALDERVSSTVVVCMMATFASLMPDYLEAHSWLLNTPGLWARTEWPDAVGPLSGRSLLVQYGETDALFPMEGMRAAHERLTEAVRGRYEGRFFPVGHRFDEDMQQDAWRFLQDTLPGSR
ncbi:acetylxylan esterase [Plantibacter sp. ME-Dv--P-122b]|uniref:acetylxylan esterase n=1 Tax=Plantibacter sp. ME-Dv--P-122b TaxID=3040300 RepID=UPI00254D5744|nr:acetylxylan esterase [Plantibacter sp. ME-Dv--P-122b]